jgi:hypothetical protein
MSAACSNRKGITGKVDFAVWYANEEIMAVMGISDRKKICFAAGFYNHWIMTALALYFTLKKFCIFPHAVHSRVPYYSYNKR